jgi:ABC-type multidrug transport system fused ATPase/permease subunit
MKKNPQRRKSIGEDFRLTLSESFNLLSQRDKSKTIWLAALQACLGLFDLAAVMVIGVLGSLAVKGIQSESPSGTVSEILKYLGLSSYPFQKQVAILGLLAGLLFISKTLFSIVLTRKSLNFLGHRSSQISGDLISRYFSLPLNLLGNRDSQLTLFSLTAGVNTLMLGVIGSTIVALSDVVLLVLMLITLAYVDLFLSIAMLAIFGTIGHLLYRYLRAKAHLLGVEGTALTISSNRNILDALATYRENFVSNSRGNLVSQIKQERISLARILVEKAFMPNITKYAFEFILVIGSLSISAYQFILADATTAVGTLTVFIAAGSRIAPASLRIQQWALQLKSNLAASIPTLDLAKELSNTTPISEQRVFLDTLHKGFAGTVTAENLSFSFGKDSSFRLENIDLTIDQGQLVAIVGPSGAGKSTLADLLLGLSLPEEGRVLVSSKQPGEAAKIWPGAISYQPQNVHLISGSIRENLTRGYSRDEYLDEDLMKAIELAQLTNLVSTLEGGLDYMLDENASNLSGGQRQRLGLARALFTKPKLLVMDEATSALDAETEAAILTALEELKGKTTVISIAHRLTTVKNADQVIYMDKGRVMCAGSFELVKQQVPDFDRQAKLLGL